jgi:hypothetical protein
MCDGNCSHPIRNVSVYMRLATGRKPDGKDSGDYVNFLLPARSMPEVFRRTQLYACP